MNIVYLLLIFQLFGFFSYAKDFSPKLKDSADYLIISSDSKIERRTQKLIYEFDKKQDQYLLSQYYFVGDENKILFKKSIETGEKLRKIFISDILAFCDSMDGKLEVIEISAGSFESCNIGFNKGSSHTVQWFAANVPFGVIKSVEVSYSLPPIITTTELVSYEKALN